MLKQLTDCGDERIECATADIGEAVDYYVRVRRGVVDEEGRRVGRRTSDTRRQLRELKKCLAATVDCLDRLNIDSRQLLADSMPKEIDFNGIKLPRLMSSIMRREMEAVRDAATRAADQADELPNKESNHDRVVLAADVARALKKHLGITPTSTTPNHDTKNAVPVYALVLEKTLAMAGERNCDWKALTVKGIALMHEMDGAEIGDE